MSKPECWARRHIEALAEYCSDEAEWDDYADRFLESGLDHLAVPHVLVDSLLALRWLEGSSEEEARRSVTAMLKGHVDAVVADLAEEEHDADP